MKKLRADDAGVGLILVIGLSAVMAILVAVTTATAIRSLKSSAGHVSFEQSLAAAEAGIDRELALIQTARNAVPPVPYANAPPCAISAPTGSFATEAAEKSWARAQLLALPLSCTRDGGQGEYLAAKVPGRQVVYSLGWSPSRGHPEAKERLLKVEYIFGPYRPGQALLTSGNIDFSGAVEVRTIAGLPADIHTNASVTGVNNSLSVSGSLSASGSLSGCSAGVTGGCKAGEPTERVPVANPRAVYVEQASLTPLWYDLCPDGSVRSPGDTPCSGAVIAASPYQNWVYTAGNATTPGEWTLGHSSGVDYPGVYYVYGANARLGSLGNSAMLRTVSVLVEATKPVGYTNATTCNKYGGDLTWKLYDIQNYMRGVIFIAEGSIYGEANSSATSGLILAGDRISLQTSSATVQGALVANNTCAAAGGNTVQGMTVTYDQSVEAPVYSVVNTTQWLEFVG